MGEARTFSPTPMPAVIRSLLIPALVMALMLALPGVALGAAQVAPTPSNTAAPTVTGNAVPGQTLTCSTGTWTNNPTGYSYAWLRDGVPIPGQNGATYVVQATDQGHSLSCKVTASNEGGNYTISSLPSGSYKISFTSESETGNNYLRQFFNGKATSGEADAVSVTAPNVTAAVNAQLHAGGQIAGRVIDAVSKAPIAGVFVCAEQIGPKAEFGGCETTNGNGEYTIRGLGTASYEVAFYSFALSTSYREQFYNGKSSYLEAEPVAVTTGATTPGINAELRPYNEGSAFEGTVTDAKTHLGVAGIEVCATPANELFIGECAKTDATGKYKITGLGETEYVVTFSGVSCTSSGCTSLNYIREYYEKAYESAKETKVVLKAHETKSLATVEMEKGGEFKGVVKDKSSGELLANVEVCATGFIKVGTETEFFIDCAMTGPTGEYVLAGLPTGGYTIRFSSSSANYLEDTVAGSTTDGSPPTTVNAELQRGGQIAGRVTDAATHAGIAGVAVCSQGTSSVCATTGAGGEYTLSRLQTGTYEVSYVVEGNEKLNYLPQTRAGVAVKQGETTAGIDAVLTPGGQITGRVTDAATHAGVAQVSVCAEGIGATKAFQCATSTGGGASASASSNALPVVVVGPCKQVKKSELLAKTVQLEFFLNCPSAGKLSWSLFFNNADIGFAASIGVSLGQSAFAGEAGAVAEVAKRKGKGKGHKPKKCKPGFIKHKGHQCKRKLVSFSSGSQSVPAGAVIVKVRPSAAALKGLKNGRTLHVSGTFTFRSALGVPPAPVKVQATIHLPKKHGGKRGKHKKK